MVAALVSGAVVVALASAVGTGAAVFSVLVASVALEPASTVFAASALSVLLVSLPV